MHPVNLIEVISRPEMGIGGRGGASAWAHVGRVPPGASQAPARAPPFQDSVSTAGPEPGRRVRRAIWVNSRHGNPVQTWGVAGSEDSTFSPGQILKVNAHPLCSFLGSENVGRDTGRPCQ